MTIFRVYVAPFLVRVLVLGMILAWILDVVRRGMREQGSECHQLSVARSVASDIGGIHSLGDDAPVVDQDAADGCLICLKSKPGLWTKRSISPTILDVSRVLGTEDREKSLVDWMAKTERKGQ